MNHHAIGAGTALTVTVHAAMCLILLAGPDGCLPTLGGHVAVGVAPSGTVRHGLCGKRRCSTPERMRLRRDPEEDPLKPMEFLEAALLPALGGVERDKARLPELQTYEQREAVEDGVNLDREAREERRLKKRLEARDARRDPQNKADLESLLREFDEDDPRRQATALDRIVGEKDGELGGAADARRAGNRYGARVRRKLQKVFLVPPFLDQDRLAKLRVRVRILRLDGKGHVQAYEVLRRSGDRSFDDAAIATIREFVPAEGGDGTLPRPPAEVLRYINENGLTITLDGGFLTR